MDNQYKINMDKVIEELNNNIKQLRKNKSEYGKKYYRENKNKINRQIRQWNINNKEYKAKINKKYRERNLNKLTFKISCPCGGTYKHQARSIHFKTMKHKQYEIENNINAHLNSS